MIDPDGIQIQRVELPEVIKINQVPEFESNIYNLEDDSDYKKYIKDIERNVRGSFEYREFIKYIRSNFNMNKCAFLSGVSNEETYEIRIEIHHYPFSLHDICDIVMKKRSYYNESLDVQMVAKEVMQLHYKCVIGLIPLSETAHELTHNSRLFIPSDKVFGRYQLFVDYYKPFISSELLDTLDRIEKYTRENTRVNDTTILDMNEVSFDVHVNEYQLPDLGSVTNNMKYQLEMIKNNNYMLPNVQEVKEILNNQNPPSSPITFHDDKVIIEAGKI